LQQADYNVASDEREGEEETTVNYELQSIIGEIRKQTEREAELDSYFPDEIAIGI